MKFEQLPSDQETIVEIDKTTIQLLEKAQADRHIKDSLENEYFERVLVAGEMTELGLDSRQNFSKDEISEIQKEISELRKQYQDSDLIPIGVVKYLHRLKQIGIEFLPLTSEETKKLYHLPEKLRTHPDDGNLIYLPQLAHVLNVPLSEITIEEDGEVVRQYLENELKQGEDKAVIATLLSGMLADLNKQSLGKLLQGPNWSESIFNRALDEIRELKEKEQGYELARVLPAMIKLIKVKKDLFSS